MCSQTLQINNIAAFWFFSYTLSGVFVYILQDKKDLWLVVSIDWGTCNLPQQATRNKNVLFRSFLYNKVPTIGKCSKIQTL